MKNKFRKFPIIKELSLGPTNALYVSSPVKQLLKVSFFILVTYRAEIENKVTIKKLKFVISENCPRLN